MKNQPVISRREAIILCGGAFVGANLTSAAHGQPSPWRLTDAHVHLFNLSDLPAEGFFEHVILPNNFADSPGIWPAFLSLVRHLKPQAVTVAAENDQGLRRLAGIEKDISGARFGLLVAQYLGQLVAGSFRNPSFRYATPVDSPAVDSVTVDSTTAYSAELMARTINALNPNRRPLMGRRFYNRAPNAIEFDQRTTVDPGTIEAIVEDRVSDEAIALAEARLDAAPDVRALFAGAQQPCAQEPSEGPSAGKLAMLFSRIKWVHLMMQSRQYHLARYLETIAEGGVRPGLISNLLVDYDRWLGDQPAPASGHRDQISLWTKIAAGHAATIDIRTFAGFDPLKDAQQFIIEGDAYPQDSDLAFYARCWRNRSDPGPDRPAIHGFKLYPPMGFRPIGNTPDMFPDPPQRAVRELREVWNRPPLNGYEVSAEIEKSLIRFYTLCDAERIPLLAHGAHSIEAGRCFGERAGPTHWLTVLRRFPNLRLCIGHFTGTAEFEIGMRHFDDLDRVPANVWSLRGMQELLQLNAQRSRVYCDISYMAEFLVGGARERIARTTNFFHLLKRYCDRYDQGCRHFVFGSDWIMLGQQPKHDRYVEIIRAGMRGAGWPSDWQNNLLSENLHRFSNP